MRTHVPESRTLAQAVVAAKPPMRLLRTFRPSPARSSAGAVWWPRSDGTTRSDSAAGRRPPSTRFQATAATDFLAVATPGAGKTTFALTAARHALGERPAPRGSSWWRRPQHLKPSGRTRPSASTSTSTPTGRPPTARLPADVHGVVTTYQQVAASAAALRPLVARRASSCSTRSTTPATSRAWGDATRARLRAAPPRASACRARRSARTPRTIPFVRYDGDGWPAPDYEYGYGDALADGRVVRPVYFPRIDGRMEWIGARRRRATRPRSTTASTRRARQPAAAHRPRRRGRVAADGAGAGPRAADAPARDAPRRRPAWSSPSTRTTPAASPRSCASGSGVVADRRDLRRSGGVRPRSPRSRAGTAPWIVAVRMVSEGVDIPRLRVGVYATNTIDRAVLPPGGRAPGALDARRSAAQAAYMFIPDDLAAANARAARSPSSAATACAAPRRRRRRGAEPAAEPRAARGAARSSSRCSRPSRPWRSARADRPTAALAGPTTLPGEGREVDLLLELAPAPLLARRRRPAGRRGEPPAAARASRSRLRDANASLVRHISRITGCRTPR